MLRVYSTSRMSPLWLLLALPLLIFVGLPLVLVSVAVLVLLRVGFALLRGPRPTGAEQSPWADPSLSPVIKNKEIGPYRIKQNERDPSVIEVLDETP
jgi:hypothetical protein